MQNMICALESIGKDLQGEDGNDVPRIAFSGKMWQML